MNADIKLNSSETRLFDELVNGFLWEQKITGREVDVIAVNQSTGNNCTISISDKK